MHVKYTQVYQLKDFGFFNLSLGIVYGGSAKSIRITKIPVFIHEFFLFYIIVHFPAGRRYDFNDEVGSPLHSLSVILFLPQIILISGST